MIISPHLGIGDLLFIKMKQVSNNLIIQRINLSKPLILIYCEDYELKVYFITKLLNLLFPNTELCVNDNPCNFSIIDNYQINKTYIYDSINIDKTSIKNEYSDYIVFHTKMRHDGLFCKFSTEVLPKLNIFLEKFKTSKKIIILGERQIGINKETTIHKTMSFYNNLLCLNKNNIVVDLTNDILTCGNSEFNKFLLDIEIINKSLCNITFGIGGPLSICKAFSKNNISFIPFYNLSPHINSLNSIMSIDNSVVENIEELNEKIYKFTNECLGENNWDDVEVKG